MPRPVVLAAVMLTKHIPGPRFRACHYKTNKLENGTIPRFSVNCGLIIDNLVCIWVSETTFTSPAVCVLGI